MKFEYSTLGQLSIGGKGSYGIAASAVPYSDKLFTYLRITDISDDGRIKKSGLMSVDDENASKYLLSPNDIVFARTGNSTGRNYFYDGSDGDFVYAGFLIKFSLDPQKVNPRFIKYYCQSKEYWNWIQSFDTGSTRKNINAQTFANMKIALPPRTQQDFLVSILRSLDDKIELNQKINDNLEKQAYAIYHEWFISHLEDHPDQFRKVSLADLMDYAGGSQPPASKFISEQRDGYVRFVQIRDYESDSHITYIPVSDKNKLCEEHDIMIARYGAALGRIRYGLNGAYNVALAKAFPKRRHFREFLRCYLSSREFYEGINNKGDRSAQAGFNQSDIRSFAVFIPINETTVQRFESLVAPIFEKRLHIIKENQSLATFRDVLLPRLMSGEIDISGIQS